MEPEPVALESFDRVLADDAALGRLFSPIIGKPAWSVANGYGSSLTFEFGVPSLAVREPLVAPPGARERVRALLAKRRVRVSGEWRLWIYCCNWRLHVRSDEVAASEDKRRKLEKAAQVLDSQLLTSVGVGPQPGCCQFSFDLGAVLHTRPYGDAENLEQWILHRPDGQVVSLLADGTLMQASGSSAVSISDRLPT